MASLLSDERLCRHAVDSAASLLDTGTEGQHVPRVIEIRLGEGAVRVRRRRTTFITLSWVVTSDQRTSARCMSLRVAERLRTMRSVIALCKFSFRTGSPMPGD